MSEFIQVYTTVGSEEDAGRMTRSLVEKRLAACTQIIGPLLSTYWWKGEIEEAKEWLCIIKSRKELYNELEQAIKEVHTYEKPEIVATSIIEGSKDYLSWLNESLKSG